MKASSTQARLLRALAAIGFQIGGWLEHRWLILVAGVALWAALIITAKLRKT
jgi:hypothetical protein